MLYCFDKKMDFEYTEDEILVSKLNNNCIFYDSEKENFLDLEGNNIDIVDKIIFPRTGCAQIFDVNEIIQKNGGIPIVSNKEINTILSWPNYYQTTRKTQILKGSDLINPDVINYIDNYYGKNIFLKTIEKNFNSVISTDLLKDKECTFYKTLIHHLDEEFIISENVDIVEDNYGKKEYRCFVINNEIYNISRMTNRVLHNIEINILEVLKKIINRMDGIFPSCYVVDIFEYYDKNGNQNIDVVEFNPIHASGIYLYNSVIEKSNDLLHSNLKNISKEFFSKIDECSVDGKVEDHSSILYDVPNSFSCDLRSICKTGNLGLIFSNATISTEDFYRHNEVYNFDSMILIESDEQLYEFTDFSNNYSDKLVEEENNMIEKLLKLNKKKYGTINNPSS